MGIVSEEKDRKFITINEEKYEFPKMTLGLLRRLESNFDCGLGDLGEKLSSRPATFSLELLLFLLQQKSPDLKLEDIEEYLDYNDLNGIGEVITSLLKGE